MSAKHTKQSAPCAQWAFTWSLRTQDRENEEAIESFKNHYKLLDSVLRDKKWKYIFQLELTGEANWHYQGYFKTEEKTRETALAKTLKEDFEDIHISKASTNGIEALKSYSMKAETRQSGPWADCEQYLGTDIVEKAKLWEWQQEMLSKLEATVDPREIMWVYDKDGNMGKSMFIKYLAWNLKSVPMQYADAKDLLYIVSEMPNRKIYTFDLTRTCPKLFSRDDLYAAMEGIKNGCFISTKYKPKVVLMKPPHILCCANKLPDLTKVSKDRWSIYTILPNKKLSKLSMTECWNIINAGKEKRMQLADQADAELQTHIVGGEWNGEAAPQTWPREESKETK